MVFGARFYAGVWPCPYGAIVTIILWICPYPTAPGVMSPQIDGMRVWADLIGLICSDFTPWIYPLAIIQATQEHPPQIGHLAAENREQFRVRVGWLHLGGFIYLTT